MVKKNVFQGHVEAISHNPLSRLWNKNLRSTKNGGMEEWRSWRLLNPPFLSQSIFLLIYSNVLLGSKIWNYLLAYKCNKLNTLVPILPLFWKFSYMGDIYFKIIIIIIIIIKCTYVLSLKKG